MCPFCIGALPVGSACAGELQWSHFLKLDPHVFFTQDHVHTYLNTSACSLRWHSSTYCQPWEAPYSTNHIHTCCWFFHTSWHTSFSSLLNLSCLWSCPWVFTVSVTSVGQSSENWTWLSRWEHALDLYNGTVVSHIIPEAIHDGPYALEGLLTVGVAERRSSCIVHRDNSQVPFTCFGKYFLALFSEYLHWITESIQHYWWAQRMSSVEYRISKLIAVVPFRHAFSMSKITCVLGRPFTPYSSHHNTEPNLPNCCPVFTLLVSAWGFLFSVWLMWGLLQEL